MFDAIRAALSNQLLSGGIVLMLTAGIVAFCRKLPAALWAWLIRRLTIVIDVSNDDALFAWLSLWLAEHPYSKKSRSLTATSERDDYGRVAYKTGEESALPEVLFTPAPGNHLLWYKRRLVWLSRSRKEATGKDDQMTSAWKREVFTLRIVGRSQDSARHLLEDARSLAIDRRTRKVEIFSASYDYWQRIDERNLRTLGSVFLPEGVSEELTDDLAVFLSSEAWYVGLGIPWRRRYLFHGVPGSGKTSVICALAGHFRMNLYILSLGNPYLTDDSLMKLLALVPSRSFVLFEDIDAAFDQRNKSGDATNKLTFSGLLNALDGAGSKDGTLIFMTTNHIERLDPALVRPGRVDVKEEFGLATAQQANRMFLAFFPGADGTDGFGEKVEELKLSMSDVQNHLIENKNSCVGALNRLKCAA